MGVGEYLETREVRNGIHLSEVSMESVGGISIHLRGREATAHCLLRAG